MAGSEVHMGSFVVGELPAALQYQFLDANGVPINLVGYTSRFFQWGELIQGQFYDGVSRLAGVVDATLGQVLYDWTGDEFDRTGRYGGYFYVSNGTSQYASTLITWQVCAAVTTPPVV